MELRTEVNLTLRCSNLTETKFFTMPFGYKFTNVQTSKCRRAQGLQTTKNSVLHRGC